MGRVATIRDSSKMLLTLNSPPLMLPISAWGQTAQGDAGRHLEAVDGTVTSVTGTDAPEYRQPVTRTVTIAVRECRY